MLIGACLLLAMAGCSSSDVDEGLVVIDVKAGHPDKELALQDFMEVEYVPLETTDEFVTQGDVLAVGEKYMVVKNWVNDGDIFLFDRQTGKGVRKWNRRGQGDEEYTYINGAVLDEDRGEVFVNCSPTRKVMVYDLSGTFKRSFSLPEGAEALAIYDYDAGSLMLYATVRNADYEGQEVDLISHPLNRGGIAAFQVLPADQLVEACGSGRLQGRLQEVAATLGEESNPVVMLMKPV